MQILMFFFQGIIIYISFIAEWEGVYGFERKPKIDSLKACIYQYGASACIEVHLNLLIKFCHVMLILV